jgi:hypothetical protein
VRSAIRAALLVTLLAGCSSDPYPLPPDPPHAGQLNPALVGKPVTAIVIYLEIRPGDRIELLGAEPARPIDGAKVRFLLDRPIVNADGVLFTGEALEALDGAVITPVSASPGPANQVGIVAELTAQRPGRFEMTSVRLRYRLNGAAERTGEGITVVWTVCADTPAPSDCPE